MQVKLQDVLPALRLWHRWGLTSKQTSSLTPNKTLRPKEGGRARI